MRVASIVFAIVAGLVVGAIITLGVVRNVDAPSASDARGLNEIAANGNIQGKLYTGDPKQEAKLVETENERLVYVRTVASAAEWSIDRSNEPYRLRTGPTFTLMLPERKAPYTAADLEKYAPDTFTREADGTYLLTESIVVLDGAKLDLSSKEGATLKLASGPDAYVSIVTIGGSLSLGSADSGELTITSWDVDAKAPDVVTDDGRAFVRVIGGKASFENARFADLGFWSGNTGGVSLTGAESVVDFDEFSTENDATNKVAGAEILAAGELGEVKPTQDYSFVSASIKNVTFDGNAFGLFVTGATGVVVRDSIVSDSLVDGLVFHRYVTDSSVTATDSINNAVDGITLSRSSTGIEFSEITASGNGRNGITLDGQPLADGPSAVGTEVDSYGSNTVAKALVENNGRYGVEISGGSDISVTDSDIAKNDMGVVVGHAAERVTVSDNSFDDNNRHSIAVRDGVVDAQVESNSITGGATGVFVRNAEADIQDNQLSGITSHGVSLVGDAREVTVAGNTIGGSGTTALWIKEAVGAKLGTNNLEPWNPAPTVDTVVSAVAQPLTLVWIALALAVLLTAFTPRRRNAQGVQHPYKERLPLSAYTQGVVARESIGDRA